MFNQQKRRQVVAFKVESLTRQLEGLRAQHASAQKEYDSFMASYVPSPRPSRPSHVSPYMWNSEMYDRSDPAENAKIGLAAELYSLEAEITKTEKRLERAQIKLIRLG